MIHAFLCWLGFHRTGRHIGKYRFRCVDCGKVYKLTPKRRK